MSRLTITLFDERHRALKEAAARRNTSIRRIIEESLDSYGVKTSESATALVASARWRSTLTEAGALALAVDENARRAAALTRGSSIEGDDVAGQGASGVKVTSPTAVSPGSRTMSPVSVRPAAARLKPSMQFVAGSAQKKSWPGGV